jgi:signal transduction histidine kinase
MKSLDIPLQFDVTAVLIDLAKLAQRAGNASGEAQGDLACDLLKRLLIACAAQRGAIALSPPENALAGQPALSPEQNNSLRLLALHEMREQEVHALLAAVMPAANAIEVIAGEGSNGIIYRLPLAEEQGRPFWYALLLLEWGELAADGIAVEQGKQKVALLAEAVASVLVTLLQAERLHEIEQTSLQGNLVTMELFKAELIATVSHELRSPLASIKGYAATLLRHERRLSRDERRQFLLAITEGTVRLEHIVDRLLEMSQLETEAITLNLALVDVSRLAQEAIKAIAERVPDHLAGRFTFSILVEDSIGQPAASVPPVTADRRRLREVLDNLLENALYYSPEGGVITVVLRPVTVDWPLACTLPLAARLPRLMLELRVCDTGIGIAPEHIERIFDRFYRVDRRLTREVNSLGVGLAICKRIVEFHNGAIWAESVPEGGSIFHVFLPLETDNEAR